MKISEDNLVCVVLPVYKHDLNEFEVVSLKQCFEILSHYPIALICSYNLNVQEYQKIANSVRKELQVIRKDPDYFSGIEGYNKLLLSEQFYSHFSSFKYILIYQTDCYVFRDELKIWCNKGYDYIGAPWINIDLYKWLLLKDLYPAKLRIVHSFFKNRFISKVGNGGFSLRNVSKFISILKKHETAAKNWKAYEDSFFSHYIGTFDPFFKIAKVDTALKFSFDIFPELAFKLNNMKLPFGCHAWNRDDVPPYTGNFKFWKTIIFSHETI